MQNRPSRNKILDVKACFRVYVLTFGGDFRIKKEKMSLYSKK